MNSGHTGVVRRRQKSPDIQLGEVHGCWPFAEGGDLPAIETVI
jgi:hypothetical protein